MPRRKLQGMTPKTAAELRAEAERLVTAIQEDTVVLAADRAAIIEAVAQDLADAEHGLSLEARLLKIEAQLQTLSAAVLAITDAAVSLPPEPKH